MHVILLAPHFPANQLKFLRGLRNVGARVTGILDCAPQQVPSVVKDLLHDAEFVQNVTDDRQVETFIPMVLQEPDAATGKSRLKRCVLIGDHHQLPPVVKNQAFQRYSRLDQSLFARFVRLGVPAVLPPSTPPVACHHHCRLSAARRCGLRTPRGGGGGGGGGGGRP